MNKKKVAYLLAFIVLLASEQWAVCQESNEILEGNLQIVLEERSDGTNPNHYLLKTDNEALEIFFPPGQTIPSLASGSHVKVQGQRQGDKFFLTEQSLPTVGYQTSSSPSSFSIQN